MSSAPSPPPPPPYTPEKPAFSQQAPPPAPPMVIPVAVGAPVYVGPPTIIVGDYPMQCTCPHCGKHIITRVERNNGLLAWIICAVLFFFGLWICCCIPFCVNACRDTEHYCPNCSVLLGLNKKL